MGPIKNFSNGFERTVWRLMLGVGTCAVGVAYCSYIAFRFRQDIREVFRSVLYEIYETTRDEMNIDSAPTGASSTMVSTSSQHFALFGRFVHGVDATQPGVLAHIERGCIVVHNGVITHIATTKEHVEKLLKKLPQDVNRIWLSPTQLCHPGLIDTHIHAPQYQFTGTATRLPLLAWLQMYTFPAEMRCEDTQFAAGLYKKLVRKLLSHGTTMAVMYGSIHLEATKTLVDVCLALGQRAIVGKVAMDQHGAVGYQETLETSLEDTEAFILYCYSQQPNTTAEERLVNPAVTPRFIPTCSTKLLQGLGDLVAKYHTQGCWVQSHIAESLDEMQFVASLHNNRRDTQIFHNHGLLTSRTIMAHGVHLTNDELVVLASTGAGIACCPLSNAFFADGEYKLKHAHLFGVNTGLGTDVAGGYSCSLLSSCRHAVCSSKVVARLAHNITNRCENVCDEADEFTNVANDDDDNDVDDDDDVIVDDGVDDGTNKSESINQNQSKNRSNGGGGGRGGGGSRDGGGGKNSNDGGADVAVMGGGEEHDVDYAYAFWTATLGGALAVGLAQHIGNFVVGKQFDAVVVETAATTFDTIASLRQSPTLTQQLEEDFERYVNLGDDRNVSQVYVKGILVHHL